MEEQCNRLGELPVGSAVITTAGALSAGGNIGRRAVFEPLLLAATHHIAACFPYRGQRDDEFGALVQTRALRFDRATMQLDQLAVGPRAVPVGADEQLAGAISFAI